MANYEFVTVQWLAREMAIPPEDLPPMPIGAPTPFMCPCCGANTCVQQRYQIATYVHRPVMQPTANLWWLCGNITCSWVNELMLQRQQLIAVSRTWHAAFAPGIQPAVGRYVVFQFIATGSVTVDIVELFYVQLAAALHAQALLF